MVLQRVNLPKETGRFRKEAYLLVYDRNEGRKLGMIAVIAKETVSGESLGLPYVVSVSHSTQKE